MAPVLYVITAIVGAVLIAMIVSMILAGVKIDPVTSVIFVLISVSGIIFGIIALRNIRDRTINDLAT